MNMKKCICLAAVVISSCESKLIEFRLIKIMCDSGLTQNETKKCITCIISNATHFVTYTQFV